MIRRIVAIAALALAALPAAAAEPARASQTAPGGHPVSIGFGVGIEPLNIVSASAGNLVSNAAPVAIYVPIQLNPQLRIEPSVGFWHVGANSNVLSPSSLTAWSLGVGGLFYLSPVAPTGIYVGGRLGIAHISESLGTAAAKNDVSSTDFSIAPVLGGEYAFASRFTVGAEVQLPIVFYGNPSRDNGVTTTTTNADRTGVSTNAVVFLRYFFM